MLQAINDRIKGWLGGFVIALISLPFALWGIQSYLGGGEAPNAATVGDAKISVQELDNSVTRKKQELRSRFGDNLPFSDAMIKSQVLDQLINQKLLEAYTRDNGYRVSDAQLFSNIRSIFSQNGEFDRATFESLIRSRNQSVPEFEEVLRNDIRVSQFSTGVRATSFVTDAEIEQLAKLEAQQREVSLLKFSADNELATITVSDEEIQTAYDARPDQFMTKEQVSVDYIELTAAQLAKATRLDEQKLKRAYDDYVAQMSQNEQRKASHILIKAEPDRATAMTKIEKIKQALAEGESFAALAKEYSDDTGSAEQGGDLDWVEHGQMVKPFEQALFALKKAGDVSDVVETQFGLHLVRLDDVREQKPETFAEKRPQLEAALRHEAVSGVFYDQTELMATTSYENPDSLDITAEALGLPIQHTELMTRSSGKGIAANPEIRKAAFSRAVLDDGVNSDVIEPGPDQAMVLRVREHVPAQRLALEQVRATLEAALKREKAHAIVLAKAREAKAKLLAGAKASSLVARGVILEKPQLLKRSDTNKIDPGTLRRTFEMPKPEPGKLSVDEISLPNADAAVVILTQVITPDKVEQAQLDTIKRQRLSELANAEYDAALAEISRDYEIHKNPRALE